MKNTKNVKNSKNTKTAPVAEKMVPVDSSFIKSVIVTPDNEVKVIMASNPNVIYAYKPTQRGLERFQSAMKNKRSVGAAFNRYLSDREVYRTIYNK